LPCFEHSGQKVTSGNVRFCTKVVPKQHCSMAFLRGTVHAEDY
jgi:hypothetical protein